MSVQTQTEREKHASFTQLNMYLRCGEQYRRRYIEGEIIPPSVQMHRGKCCHKAEEKNFRQKIETKLDLPVEAVLDEFSAAWEAEKTNVAFTEEELSGDSPTVALGRFKDSGVGLIKVFHAEIAPSAKPTQVEREFWVRFEGGYLPLMGFIDRIDEDIVVEQKFVSKSPSKGDIDSDVQVTSYDLGFRSLFQQKPRLLEKVCAVATKVPKTHIQQCSPRTDEQINHLLWRLEAFMEGLNKGIFLPASNGHWCCSPRWCGYYHSCKYRQ